ncbi:MAG: hypothetical protein MJB14_09865 [Spirochaetes bacterium]|nr:hypothetical protein [Spirochaetota bacterium]
MKRVIKVLALVMGMSVLYISCQVAPNQSSSKSNTNESNIINNDQFPGPETNLPEKIELNITENTRAISSSSADSYEPDDYVSQSKEIVLNAAAQEHNFYDDAQDILYFQATAGQKYTLETWITGNADTILAIYEKVNGSYYQLERNDDKASGDYGSLISDWTAPNTETYYIAVNSYNSRYGSNRNYTIQLTGTEILNEFLYTYSDPYTTVDFGSDSSKSITVKNAAGKSIYLVKANVSNSAVSSSSTGSGPGLALSSELAKKRSYSLIGNNEQKRNYQPAEEFNAKIPIKIQRHKTRSSQPIQSVDYGENTAYSVGDTKDFWVKEVTWGSANNNHDNNRLSETWIQMTCTLRAIGDHCYIWIADKDYTSSSSSTTDNQITQSRANQLRDKFEVIFDLNTNIFGYEFGGGPGGDGGRDQDQHISIVAYDIDNDYDRDSDYGYVVGYFWAKDFFTQAEIDSYGLDIKTNYGEIFYIDSRYANVKEKVIYSTLAHEYQHMIHFNEKTVEQDLSSSTWYNEMCSMVAEDLLNDALELDFAGSPRKRLIGLNESYYESGVIDWLDGNHTLKSYASAYGFGNFLARYYGGAQMFSQLLANNKIDEASVTQALQSLGYGKTFDEIFQEYATALVYNDPGQSSKVRVFNKETTSSLNGYSYHLVPTDIYDMYYDHDKNSSTPEILADPPVNFDPGNQVALRPYGFSIHTADAWKNVSGDVEITLNKPADSNVVMYLMVR